MASTPEGSGAEPLGSPLLRLLGSVWLGPLLALGVGAGGFLLFERLPERVPTHWGIDGRPDGWMSRGAAVAGMPLFILGIVRPPPIVRRPPGDGRRAGGYANKEREQ